MKYHSYTVGDWYYIRFGYMANIARYPMDNGFFL